MVREELQFCRKDPSCLLRLAGKAKAKEREGGKTAREKEKNKALLVSGGLTKGTPVACSLIGTFHFTYTTVAPGTLNIG